MNIEQLRAVVANSYSYTECMRVLGKSDNGIERKKLKELLDINGISRDHFDSMRSNRLRSKYETVTKTCPICDNTFTTKKNNPREQTTCSRSCSNTYFNGVSRNINIKNHRTICFRFHKKSCVICGESNIVEAHHLDHNSKNNAPDNLIPLCPTHHQYWHSRHKKLIEPQIRGYIQKWKVNNNSLK